MHGMMAAMGLWMLLWGLIVVAVAAASVLGVVALARHRTRPSNSRAQPVSDDASRHSR
jgi:hypothetical protein